MTNPHTPATIDNVDVNLPLYDALFALHDEICRRFPAPKFRSGVNLLGIEFVPPGRFVNYGDWCTPLNTLSFAWTGGGGEHYSFLVAANRIDEKSPIILTAPSSGSLNLVIAPDFQSFLRAGLTRDFFGLSQFAYGGKEAFEVYGNDKWLPTKPSDYSNAFVPDAVQKDVMEFVAQELKLEPYFFSEAEFYKMQSALDSLEMSEEYHDMVD